MRFDSILVATIGFLCLLIHSPHNLCVAQSESYPVPPEARKQAGVPEGKVLGPFDFESKIFPGTSRQYHLYVPEQYDASKPTPVLIVQDGVNRARGWKLPQILDNLIHAEEVPAMIGVFVQPGIVKSEKAGSQPRFNRSFEYDSLGDRYARFLLEELLPKVSQDYNLSQDPNDRALAGASSGGICAFNAAWERPDAFRRVISTIGTYVGLRGGNQLAALVRKHEAKPLRVFLQDGSSDLNIYAGDWWTANQDMLSALKWAGYDVQHEWGHGGHNGKHGAAIMPQALKWLWRDYPEPIRAAVNKEAKRRVELLVEGAGWEEVSSGHEAVEALTANAGGQIFFSDAKAGRVYRIDQDSKTRIFADQSSDIVDLAYCPDGNLLGIQTGAIVKFGPDGKLRSFLPETQAECLVSLPEGVYFYDRSSNKIQFASFDGKVKEAGVVVVPPVAMTPTVDHAFLHSVGQTQSTFHSAILAGQLKYRQEYGFLEMPYLRMESGVSSAVMDQDGLLYVSSTVGVQVLDQLGRVNFIIAPPNRKPIEDIVFGGANLGYLYVATSSTVFRRKLNTKGVVSFAQPIAPPKPGL